MHPAPGLALALFILSLVGCDSGLLRPPQGWQRVFPSFAAPVYDLLRDPADPRVIYAACGWQPLSQTQRIGGVLRSADRGERWVAANRGIPPTAEVLTLAFAPLGFIGGDSPALVAGTRGAGIYVSIDGGSGWRPLTEGEGAPDWQRLTLQTLVALPGKPPAMAAGTQGYGVLVSEDGGESWQFRNEGLLNLSVQTLTSDASGSLLAATWYGGIYRSHDRGRHWTSLSPAYERVAVSALELGDDGTLWIGLQNGGLSAAAAGELSFEPQGEKAIEGVGILSIRARTDRVVVGTSGRGAVIGRRGARFVAVDAGLDNKTVSTVLLAPDDPDEVLVGTWGGLYRSIPPRSLVVPRALGVGVLSLALMLAFIAWHRSTAAAAGALFRRLKKTSVDQVPGFLARETVRLPPERAQVIVERLAARLARSRDGRLSSLAEFIAAIAPLLGLLKTAGGRTDAEIQRATADALKARIPKLEALAKRWQAEEKTRGTGALARAVALQDGLFAGLLRAESLGHVAALQADLLAIEERTTDALAAPFLNPELVTDLRGILEVVDQLSRLPSAEDRALYLGQALSRTLAAQARLAHQRQAQPTFRLEVGTVVLESVRELLATALQDIHQRAELKATLHSKVLATQREALVVLEVKNVGQGHARNIAVELQPGDGFRSLRRRREVKSLLRNQSARLEFLVEPRVSDRVRLSFDITYDDLERQGHRREFADVVEFRQIRARQAFRPLRPNPYVVGRPLLESDVFIGRQEVFARLAASLRGVHQDNVVVLMGPRRMGKTSILRRLHHHLGEGYAPVLVDLQGMIGSGEAAFFRELVATLHDELEELGIAVPEPPSEAFEHDPGTTFRRRFLRDVRQVLGERRLLLMFDEFEVLESRIRSGDLKPRILPYFRSLMQHERSVSFIFSGTHRLDELTHEYWGVLFNLAVYLEVGHLPEDKVKQLFTQPTAGVFEIDPLALDKVCQLTGGHPHFSQLVARELAELRNWRQLSYVTVQDVNEVAEQVVEKGQLHIAYLWDEAPRNQRLLLLALKELLERKGLATLSAIHRYLSERRIEAGDLSVALRRLVRREILDDNGGLVSFCMELLRLWLDRHHDLESFLISEGRDPEA